MNNTESNRDFKLSIFSILEFLDPIASKVISNLSSSSYSTSFEREVEDNGGTDGLEAPSKPQIRHLHRYHSDGLITKIPIDELKKKVLLRVKRLDEPLQSIFFKHTTKLEKLFYPFTLSNIFLIGFIMGKFPEWFHIYYTVLLCILMPIRFYTYYKAKNHYFMADLCYFVNFMCLLFIWVFPNANNLFQSCFALTFGSLSFAVITWRNSLVLHSIDKTTSCFIHIMPPCTMYVIFHALPEPYKAKRFPGATKYVNLKTNVLWTSFYYLIWQCLYHYFITLKKSSKIKAGERMTSFEYLTGHQFKNFWAVKLKAPWPLIIYTLLQYFYQLGTMLLCTIWLGNKTASSLFLLFIFLSASFNGATYYVDYYGKNFEKEVDKLRQELELLQQQINNKNSANEDNKSFESINTSSVYSLASNDAKSIISSVGGGELNNQMSDPEMSKKIE
ncbi:hypothetical protein KAFR_0I00950 [Kazachstania africana CBS 2517]|uniref:Glycerophosphocholine acyltransferase 1 n=1 Tax=Kazachstania africana (strain ATCC 22294 / BCRC 22015 / CBS 2517 / CECT 1963 / NBRC 1671 / NRRL Y-8276) TaxID=1071382 RepID=H2AZS6_KAZAF|nr:hypothetical protein KAFR_0I00950 [Kazachstania africana CBS 2517]CCF59876.1 hypothetical protein KAFR_0I00950 [Kazachstania africana CBS 2517]